MSAERGEYIDRVTRHLVPADDHEARASMTLDGIYGGGSEKIHRLIRLAYRRGVRRGASSAWHAQQPIGLRSEHKESE